MATAVQRTYPFDNDEPAHLTGTSPLDCVISAQELDAAVKGGRPTCPGGSKINRTILLYLPNSAFTRLWAIFNAALSAGNFPNEFKQAEMRMILKAGKVPTHLENYCLISLLEVPGKLLERIITSWLRIHLETGNLLYPAQYGFRSGRGAVHAIALATETMALHQANRS
ncbi:RNA-directed DNA polymerase from mobile element jockey [Portunus trituberculatus]|uniref:RNA-directed DNA polymerase from mobile element jockey n=1 Tax=Portunus trituberculatus TaxID=210409 RepID=A0A5B7FH29_PORTR|nr:RNA-directed DNA polymerase from mobile element jockey [Portunus trituberculatus]